METHAKLRELIDQLIEAKREYTKLAFDREQRFELGSPCTAEELGEFAAIVGRELPPSYRAFLELHNGWKNFDGDVDILAVEEYKQPWLKERVEWLSSLFEENGEWNPFKNGAIPIVLGNDEPVYTVLDPKKVRKNGEMAFITFDITQEQDRFKDFIEFLDDDLALSLALIEEETDGVLDEDEDDEE